MLLSFLGSYAETNYPFTELKYRGTWGVWYDWHTARNIGEDLQNYYYLKKQKEKFITNIILTTNIIRVDNDLIESYKKSKRKTIIISSSVSAGITAILFGLAKLIIVIVD